MLELSPATVQTTIANWITLIIPLGLLLLTMAWLAWQLHGRRRS